MYVIAQSDRIRQGDIFKNVEFRDAYKSGNDVTFDFCIVLTQDCDLEQDVNATNKMSESLKPDYVAKQGQPAPNHDKYLNNILLCPAFTAEDVRSGIHLASLGWTMQSIASSTMWNDITRNNNARYHYLQANARYSLPALVLDFKRVYALPKDYMNSILGNKAAQLEERFSQSVNNRYSAYISRVALPELDESGEIKT